MHPGKNVKIRNEEGETEVGYGPRGRLSRETDVLEGVGYTPSTVLEPGTQETTGPREDYGVGIGTRWCRLGRDEPGSVLKLKCFTSFAGK